MIFFSPRRVAPNKNENDLITILAHSLTVYSPIVHDNVLVVFVIDPLPLLAGAIVAVFPSDDPTRDLLDPGRSGLDPEILNDWHWHWHLHWNGLGGLEEKFHDEVPEGWLGRNGHRLRLGFGLLWLLQARTKLDGFRYRCRCRCWWRLGEDLETEGKSIGDDCSSHALGCE